MKIKKLLGFVLALSIIVTLFAGCGAATPSVTATTSTGNAVAATVADTTAAAPVKVEKKTFTVMTWGDESDMKKNLESAYAAFPDLKDKYDYQILIGGKQDGDMYQKIRLSLASANDLPDAFQANRSGFVEFADAGVLEDVSKAYEPVKSNVTKGALELVSYKGTPFAFPYEIKTKLWFYRSDMFEAAGIKADDVKNLDDFIAAGKKLQAKYPKSYIWNIGPQMGSAAAYNLGTILSGNGAKFVDDSGNYIVDTDPGVKAAFDAFKKIKDANITAPINDWTPDWEKAYADGTIASVPTGNWMKFFIPKYAKDQAGKWAVAQFPEMGGAAGGSEAAGSLYAILKDAKNKDAAVDVFSHIFLTKEGNLSMRKQAGHEAWTPCLVDSLADPSVSQADPYFGATLPAAEALAMDTFKVFNFTPAASTEFKIVNGYLDKVLAGSMTTDDALKAAEKDLKGQIGNPFKK